VDVKPQVVGQTPRPNAERSDEGGRRRQQPHDDQSGVSTRPRGKAAQGGVRRSRRVHLSAERERAGARSARRQTRTGRLIF
jgi:hypothetical protein